MNIEKTVIARVVSVKKTSDTKYHVALVVGDKKYEAIWEEAPTLGDVFLIEGDQSLKAIKKIGSSASEAWKTDNDAMRWRQQSEGKTRMSTLWKRHKIKQSIRKYFDHEGFVEIDSPLLVHGTTPDTTINSFCVEDRYLVTSTEYQIKRLEVAGFDKIYTLTQNFRYSDGDGPYRNPEFTMLEWARVGSNLLMIENDVEQLVLRAHNAIGGKGIVCYQGNNINLQPPWEHLTVAEAITRYIGTSMLDFSLKSIKAACIAANIQIRDEWAQDRCFLFSLLADHIQQYLGLSRPVFLQDWPSFQTSSAQEKVGSETAERAELFIAGVELSDGFPSLTDHVRQRETFQSQLERRKIEKAQQVRLDEAYIESLRVGLPIGAGMALGLDRLVMLLTDQADIRSVLAFAWDEV